MTKLKLKIAGTELEYEGEEAFLETNVLPLLEAVKRSHNEEVKRGLLDVCQDLQQSLAALESYSASMSLLTEEHSRRMTEFSEKSAGLLEAIESHAGGQAEIFEATQEMQEMQMSFNLQYLALQAKMSHENRQFTAVSNIMKVKHDTAWNAINNIR